MRHRICLIFIAIKSSKLDYGFIPILFMLFRKKIIIFVGLVLGGFLILLYSSFIFRIETDQVIYQYDVNILLYISISLFIVVLILVGRLMKAFAKAQQSLQDLQKFKLAVDNASDCISITDKDGIILYVNGGMEKITGFKPEEVLGKKIGSKDLWGGDMSLEFYQKLWTAIKTKKQKFSVEFNNHRQNGEEFVAAVSISPILDEAGEVKFFVSIDRDITVVKRIDLAKTEFVSLASHQLRTPLTFVKWYSEMLLNDDVGPLGKDQRDFTQEIYNSNERMIDLVDSLLDVSRLDLGTLKIKGAPTDILKAIKDLIKDVGPLMIKKKVKLIEKYDRPLPIIELDKRLFFVIIQNLLTNAIKYSKMGGEIILEIRCDGTANVLIKVADKGCGIPIKDQARIFDKLFRADNARKIEPDGNGLGLYIVNSVVKQCQGKFWFESKENAGSTFYISLPIKLPKK